MTDFAALIDRAIARRTRGRLAAFLTIHEHVEFSTRRKLDPEEAALVLTALDAFHLDGSSASLSAPELTSLYHRLATLAAKEDDFSAEHVCRMRNACFDALAGLKAMEVRLSSFLDLNGTQRRLNIGTKPAND